MDGPGPQKAPRPSSVPRKRDHAKAKDGWLMPEIGETRVKKASSSSARRSRSVAGPCHGHADSAVFTAADMPGSVGDASAVVDLTAATHEDRCGAMGPPPVPMAPRAPSGRAARRSAAHPEIDRNVLLAANSAVCLAVSAASTIVQYAYMAPPTSARASLVQGSGAYVEHDHIPPSGSVPDSLEHALYGAIRDHSYSRPEAPACSPVYTAAGSATAGDGCPTTTVSYSARASPVPTTSTCNLSGCNVESSRPTTPVVARASLAPSAGVVNRDLVGAAAATPSSSFPNGMGAAVAMSAPASSAAAVSTSSSSAAAAAGTTTSSCSFTALSSSASGSAAPSTSSTATVPISCAPMLVPGSRSRFWDRSQSSGADSDGTSGASSPARARSPLRPTGGAPAATTSILAGAEAYLRTEGGEKGRKARKATAAKVAAASQCAALVGNISALGPGELRLAACAQVAEIIQIAQTSGNLKGVYVRRLKEAASRVSDIVDTLVTRNPESEAWKLGNENARLRMELSSLREENRSYRREFEDMRKALKASASVAEPAPAVMAAPTPVPVKRKAQAATAEAAAVPEPPAAPAAVKKSRPARAAVAGPTPAPVVGTERAPAAANWVAPTPAPTGPGGVDHDAFVRAVIDVVAPILDARFAGIEDRLNAAPTLRPPLAADRGKAPAIKPAPKVAVRPKAATGAAAVRRNAGEVSTPVPMEVVATPAVGVTDSPPKKKTNRGGVKWRLKMQRRAARDAAVALTAPATAPVPVVSAPRPAPRQRTAPAAAASVVAAPAVRARIAHVAPPPAPVAPAPAPEGGAWTTVVKRKKGKGARADGPPPPTQAQAAPLPSGRGQQQRKQAAKPAVVFREPKSAAVIIKLLPAAAAKGVGYREVFAKASTVVDIAAMGLREGLKVVRTVRDARLLEFQPGPESAVKADRVAEALRGALAGMAEVVRPVKRGELYVSGLDESVTVDGLRDAIARAGNCRRDDVRTKHIGAGPGGLGASYVMCPVAAAKVIVEMGYLVVGFTSARVEALETRPIRCYRCYNVGHGAQTCPDTCPDRTNLCLRCGKSGHKMPDCTARNPHCAACAAGGLNAAHPTLARFCQPPYVKGKFVHPRTKQRTGVTGVRAMDTSNA
ncbi:hypothetical protein K1T71_007220 [Dendrolimus kikuchii]|uniref:Uncharacterized protein n=1 Tax=Dendrolimus kikuchii TaxID=765133 RepID=A0ACC1CZT9_9NEOP|nr:hypothetical protein K1T71_007220 [Dendrolimus kikuchii]